MDIDTRKLLTMHGGFSMNSDVDRLYLSRKKGGPGLISVKFAIDHEQRNLSFYVHRSGDLYIMQVASNYGAWKAVQTIK